MLREENGHVLGRALEIEVEGQRSKEENELSFKKPVRGKNQFYILEFPLVYVYIYYKFPVVYAYIYMYMYMYIYTCICIYMYIYNTAVLIKICSF